MSKTFLPTVGKIYLYLFKKMKLLPLDASMEEFEQYQLGRLQEVVKLASQTLFYKRKFQEFGVDVERVEKVSDLKFRVTRSDVEKYQHLMRRKGCHLTFKAYTSGSTGKPLGITHTYGQLLFALPFQVRFCRFIGLTKMDNALLIFPYNTSSFILSVAGFSLAGFRIRVADYFDLTEQLQLLQKATVIFGHGTKILHLIQQAEERSIKNLKTVAFISEPIVPSGKRYIESKSGAKVFGVYGSIEAMCPIAITCERGVYHLMPEFVLMEVDENKDVILTFLDERRATILLRYEIGDKATVKNCRCGNNFPSFHLNAKFKHLTSQRIEEAICSSNAFKEGSISPYFDCKIQVMGCKRRIEIFLEKQGIINEADVVEEIKSALLYGNKEGTLGRLYALPLIEGGCMEIEVKLVKKVNRVKNPRFW